jgi:hypothetical protein
MQGRDRGKTENLDLYYIMAAACVKSGRKREAISAYKKYIEL